MLIWIILSTLGISLIAILAAVSLSFKDSLLDKLIKYLIALSIGALLGGAFLHLLPEAAGEKPSALTFALLGIVLFLVIEKVLHWRHCHDGHCEKHPFTYLVLIGDSVHNLIDGVIIAGAFLVDWKIGLITVVAIALHEIPQELGDFAILVYGGFTKKKALLINFLSAITVVIGGIAGYFLFERIENWLPYILALAAGGFIYISLADLIPELHREKSRRKQMALFAIVIIGMILMYMLTFFE